MTGADTVGGTTRADRWREPALPGLRPGSRRVVAPTADRAREGRPYHAAPASHANRRLGASLLFWVVLALPLTTTAQDSVQVEALMPGMAVLTIDGRRHTLREGDSAAGVRLLSASGKEAVLEIGGERRRAGVSDRIAGAYTAPEKRSVSVSRDERMQYRTSATINGRRMEVLIDTGANVVAMSRQHAAALGIDASNGQPTRVETAGNTVAGHIVTLGSVDVGGIRVDNVRATVVDGDFPRTVLLGMSYLRHVQLSEENGVLSLTSRW